MMFNVVTKTLYQKRRFIIGWSIGVFAVSVLMLLLFPALQKSDIGQLLQGMSPALEKAIGAADTFSTADKYITGELFGLRMPLLFIVLSIILCSSLIVADERKGILASQLSLPLSRSKILDQKLLAALLIMAMVGAAMFVGIAVGLLAIGETASWAAIVRHCIGCLLVALNFGLVVVVLSSFGRRAAAVGVASGLAFLSYLISSLAPVATVLEPFEKFSLFHFYQNPSPMSWGHVGVLLAIAAVEIVISVVTFNRRDID